MHTCLAVTPEGIMLGVLDQYTYTRPEPKDKSKSHTDKKYIPIEEKESFRWLETMRKSNEGIPPEIRVINVCDREGDMYELFERAQETDRHFLIRIVHNRRTTEDTRLIDAIRAEAPCGTVAVAVPRDSRRNLKPREALLTIRYRGFEIKKPDILRANQELNKRVSMNVIYVREEVPEGAGYEPIEWFLATNEPVTSIEEAYEKVGYYLQRWKIERFHYVLKSGCKVEKLQERTLQKTEVLLLLYSIIAVCILNMTYLARVNPDLPCSILLEKDEWQLLYRTGNKSHETPQEPYSIKDAIIYLSRLGGPKRAPSDGPPGVKTIWMGLMTLNTLLAYRDYLS
ncbi:hypothetical protein FACS1894137_05980 [Spirochaetia bacterium]|nr:hypothetical protein FACS1894137_05980 [Spirochaetia bacterium]